MAEIAAGTNTIVGYFESHSKAESAIHALQNAGFQANEVGVAAHSGLLGGTSTTHDSTAVNEDGPDLWTKVRNFFDGNAAEPYAEEGTRGDLATREITTADTGSKYASNYDNYEHEDVHGTLSDLMIPADQSRYFGDKLRNGGALVTVSAGNREDEAIALLEENGADLGDAASGYVSQYESGVDTGTPVREDARTENRNIQLYGEVLRVHKDRINRGEVRIRKEVITETQTIEVPVTREELVLERVQVDGRPAAPDAAFGGESEIRVPLTEERASIEKQAVVTEEVRVGKREVKNVESLSDQVRHEELKVEDETKNRAS